MKILGVDVYKVPFFTIWSVFVIGFICLAIFAPCFETMIEKLAIISGCGCIMGFALSFIISTRMDGDPF